jgi:hypothetical protein
MFYFRFVDRTPLPIPELTRLVPHAPAMKDVETLA